MHPLALFSCETERKKKICHGGFAKMKKTDDEANTQKIWPGLIEWSCCFALSGPPGVPQPLPPGASPRRPIDPFVLSALESTTASEFKAKAC